MKTSQLGSRCINIQTLLRTQSVTDRIKAGNAFGKWEYRYIYKRERYELTRNDDERFLYPSGPISDWLGQTTFEPIDPRCRLFSTRVILK